MDNGNVLFGSVRTLINREEYYSFGETAFGSYQYKRHRHCGKDKDSESGLYNYGQRYYAPWLCRFISVDPIAESYPQLSSYNYAGNKPITSPDIDGLQGTEDEKVVTDGAGRDAIIDSGAEIVEADTAIISKEGDKFVNVNGVGLVKESHLKSQSILPKSSLHNSSKSWFDKLLTWGREHELKLDGSGDKSGIVKSGLTHVSEDASEINNSGIEAKKVSGHIEVDALQYILRGTPGSLNTSPSNWVDGLSSGVDAFNEILNLEAEADVEEPKYDFPIPNAATEKQSEEGVNLDSIVPDSIIVEISERVGLHRTQKFLRQSVNDTTNGILTRPLKNGWQTDSIISTKPIIK